MAEFLITFLVFVAVVAAMGIGVMRGRKPITGSCGGLSNLGVGGACEICGGDLSRCKENNPAGDISGEGGKTDFYDAA